MDIYIYSDESGVFDVKHHQFFVFGGIIFLSKESKDVFSRKYAKAEDDIRGREKLAIDQEVKAATISNGSKAKLFRSMNQVIRFGTIISEEKIVEQIWKSKKSKQRYLDFAFKIAVKRCFEHLIHEKRIEPDEVRNLYFFMDEHTTATDGYYELRESLEQEFKIGNFNFNQNRFYPSIFPNLQLVNAKYCNSKSTSLIRAADIVANKIFYYARTGQYCFLEKSNLYICYLP